jgi:hypothetical protein
MVEYFSFIFLGRTIVFKNLIITRRRLIANIGAIDCYFETGSLEFVDLVLLDLRVHHKNFVRLNTEQ